MVFFRVCFQTFAAAGDIFDAEMDSSDGDGDDGHNDVDDDDRKHEHTQSIAENKGGFC